MCMGADIPKTPERQEARSAITSPRDMGADNERRRRGMMATILTSARGSTSPLSTTAGNPTLGA